MTTAHSWTQKLLADAADLKVCRNCGLCYMRDDSQSGYCKFNDPARPPEVPLVVDESHTCSNWIEAPKKETPRDAPKTPTRPAPPKSTQATLPKSLPKIQGLPKRPPQPFGKRRGPPTPKDDA